MDVTALSSNNALSPGSDLWVIPNKDQSKWAKKMDWYLNFLIAKAEHRKPATPSKTLQKTLKDYKVPDASVSIEESKLLIASSKLLPNQKTLQLNYNGDFSHWLQDVEKSWQDLKSPSLRIFLPQGVKSETFWQTWTQNSPPNEVLFVEDLES